MAHDDDPDANDAAAQEMGPVAGGSAADSDSAADEHAGRRADHQYDADGLDLTSDAFLKYSYVIMFDGEQRPTDRKGNQYAEGSKEVAKWQKIVDKRVQVVAALRQPAAGLHVTRKKSSDKQANATYILISAGNDRLEAEAERRGLVMRLKGKYGGGFTEFELSKRHMFQGSKAQFFRHSQMMWLIDSIIQADVEVGGAGLNLAKLIRHNVISKFFGLHNTPKRKQLIKLWGKSFFKKQPLDSIRNYFGEEIALYFAWLGFYTKWLWVAAIPGVVVNIMYFIDRFGDGDGWSIWPVTAYSIFLAMWATFFLEYWKRFEYSMSWKWGMTNFEVTEHNRPDFKGEKRDGLYTNGEWISLDPVEDKKVLGLADDENVPRTSYSPKRRMFMKMAAWSPMTLFGVALVLVGTSAILAFRLFLQVVEGQAILGALIGGSMNAIWIIMTNQLWKMVSIKLTNVENHRTQTEWDDSFLIKTFVFQFVNSYSSFYYLAFFKRGFAFFGDASLTDSCRTGQEVYNVVSFGCLDEVTLQVASVMGTNMFIGQAREVALPYVMSKINLYLLKRKTEAAEQEEMEALKFPQWEKESKLAEFEGTFDEYNEMVIQFGYITMFAAALPIATFFAVLNNIVEIRTDALKLLTSHPRPHYKGASDIGGWQSILEFLGVLAVITNTMLIGLSFESVRDWAYADDDGDTSIQVDQPDARRLDFMIFVAAILLEHFLLALKFGIAFLIPDSPGWVRKELARQEYIHDELLSKLDVKKIKKSWNVDNSDDDSDGDGSWKTAAVRVDVDDMSSDEADDDN